MTDVKSCVAIYLKSIACPALINCMTGYCYEQSVFSEEKANLCSISTCVIPHIEKLLLYILTKISPVDFEQTRKILEI